MGIVGNREIRNPRAAGPAAVAGPIRAAIPRAGRRHGPRVALARRGRLIASNRAGGDRAPISHGGRAG